TSLAAIDYVDVGPAIAIEIDNRNGRPQGGHFRHNGGELCVKNRRMVNEVDVYRVSDLFQKEPITAQCGRLRIGFGTDTSKYRRLFEKNGRGEKRDEED